MDWSGQYHPPVLVVGLVVLVVFVGALVRATFGFGEAIVAMPLLALLPITLPTAASLMGLVGLAIAAASVAEGRGAVDRGVLVRLGVGTLVGVPAGLLLVRSVPEEVMTVLLGGFLVAYGAYALTHRTERPSVATRWASPVGVVAGALGSAYSFHGMPVAVYGTLRGWSPEVFRGTLQAFFLVSGALVVAAQGIGGLWSRELVPLAVAAVPAVAVAMLLGRALHTRMPPDRFHGFVHLLVVGLGLVLVVRALAG